MSPFEPSTPTARRLRANGLAVLLIGLMTATTTFAQTKTPATPTVAEYTQYFIGESLVAPPDGKRTYGPPRPMLVKRVVSPEQNTINEVVLVGPERFEVKLVRVEQTNEFKLTAKPARYEGKVTFAGKAWRWSSWTYEISFFKQGKLTGKGQIQNGKFTTQKDFFGPDGKQTAKITDSLKSITENEYRAALATWKITPPPPTR